MSYFHVSRLLGGLSLRTFISDRKTLNVLMTHKYKIHVLLVHKYVIIVCYRQHGFFLHMPIRINARAACQRALHWKLQCSWVSSIIYRRLPFISALVYLFGDV